MTLVFVYGTLKRGYSNYRVIERAGGLFRGYAYLKDKEMYYAYSPYSFPAVIKGKGKVYGEIFKVHSSKIHILDGLEGYDRETDRGMYLRRKAQAIRMDNGKKVWVQYYLWNRPVDKKLKIPSGAYTEYDDRQA